jgi:hypothetical protein
MVFQKKEKKSFLIQNQHSTPSSKNISKHQKSIEYFVESGRNIYFMQESKKNQKKRRDVGMVVGGLNGI